MTDPTPPDAIDIDPGDIVPPPTSRSTPTDLPPCAAVHAHGPQCGPPYDTVVPLVERFNEISDAAGNPGAPTPTGAAHDFTAIAAKLDNLAEGIANLSMRLRDEHEQLTAKLDMVLTALADQDARQMATRRTLDHMDRITRYDAEGTIARVLASDRWTGQKITVDALGPLSNHIAEALYGDANELEVIPTETAPVLPDCGRDGPDHYHGPSCYHSDAKQETHP